MKFTELIERTTTLEDTIKFLYEKKLLLKEDAMKCSLCNSNMCVETCNIRHGINKRFRCIKRSCRKTLSLFKESIFENIRIPLKKALQIIYFKALKLSFVEIGCQLSIDEETISEFLKKVFKPIDTRPWGRNHPKLGGNNKIVEVNETHLVSRRDSRGRILTGERYWILGVFCRETKEIRLMVSRNRNAAICTRFICDNVERDSVVISDEWRGYSRLTDFGFSHYRICHKRHFVDPEHPWIHTQNIENKWRWYKNYMPQVNTFELISLYTNRFVYKNNLNLKRADERFEFILSINKR